ncbi:MAG: rhodanese-like domain-containing protein [Hyphomicrobium sp.]
MTTDQPSTSRGRTALALAAAVAFAGLAGSLILSLGPVASDFTLPAVEADVAKRFPMVTQMPVADLAAKLESATPPLLIDVREDAEYRVSHIADAERADPEGAIADVVARFAGKAQGREIVFYCSVGMRSSVLALETQDALVKAGATGVANLRGGLFAWHNAHRPVVNAAGATDAIHPYNAQWGTLLARKDQIRMDVTQ